MRYASCFSGIEAATVAWHPLGWEPVFFSEIEKFPKQVLAHHYPHVPDLGDITKIQNPLQYGTVDLVVGGSPCQSFSVAGLRKGLADPRGNLALEYLRLVDQIQPRWVVWENVPGVLSSSGGRDFGAFLGALAELGYGFAYRVLDAQFFGVPQRRRRVFVVAHSGGDYQRAAAVLFESESVRGNFTPRGKTRKDVAPTLSARTKGGGGLGTDFDCDGGLIVDNNRTFTDTASTLCATYGTKWNGNSPADDGSLFVKEPSVPCFWDGTQTFQTLDAVLAKGQTMPEKNRFPAVIDEVRCFAQNTRDEVREMDVVGALAAQPGMKQTSYLRIGYKVRRITPREAERLQGFPDDYTKINDKTADGPRYKALGNSMAVPVMRWIGERIQKVDDLYRMRLAHGRRK